MALKPMIQMAALGEQTEKQPVTSGRKPNLPALPARKIQNTAGADDKEGANASSGAGQKGAYYSRPKLGTFTDRLLGDTKDAESRLQQAYRSCTTARRELEKAQTNMDTWAKHVQMIRENHMKNGTAQTAEQLKKAQGFALEYLARYNEKKTAYESAYADYEPARKRYGQAVTAYNNYIQNQQDQLSAWKNTIRDTAAIQTDMDALDSQIRETEDEIGRLKTLTRGRNDQLGQFMKDSMAQSQVKLEQMKASRAMLQEEYDWSRLSTMGDIDVAESFGSLSADDRLMTMDLLELESWSPEEKKLLQNYVMQSNAEAWGDKRDLMPTLRDARGNADALFRKYGEDKVKAMAESYTRYLNSQNAQLMTDTAIQGANNHGLLHSLLSVGANALNSISSPLGYLQEQGNRTGRYSTLDPNNAGNALGQYAGTVRGQVAQNISGDQYDESGKKIKDGGILRQAGAELYGAGMSAADSLVRMMLGGGNKYITKGLGATGSFGSTVSQMARQGATPEQAITMGLINGGLEILTEEYSLERLLNMASSGKQSIKQILKNILVQGAVEVSEEEMSFLGSTLAEAVVMREKSGYNQRIQELMAQGNTREQAKEIANRELWQEAGQTAVQSFLSGGMMAGGTAAVNARRTAKIGKQFAEMGFDKADIQDLIDSGLASDPDTESHQIALKLDQELAAGKTPSNYDLARLWQANEAAIQEEEASRAEGAEILEQSDGQPVNGVTENAPGVMPEAESVVENRRNVTQDAQNITQTARNVTAAPVSLAAQLRQNQTLENAGTEQAEPEGLRLRAVNDPVAAPLPVAAGAAVLQQNQVLNGGTINGTEQRIAGPAAARLTGTAADQRTGLLPGSSQRYDGTGTGEQTRGMAGRAGSAAQNQILIDRRRATVDRQNRIRSLRLPKISSKELGIQSGTDQRNIRLVPQEHWDAEMEQIASRVYQETGKQVSYVMGPIQIRGSDGNVRNVRGVVSGKQIVVRADHLRLSMEQIADHEAYHGRVDYFGDNLNQEIRRHIVETYSEEEFRAVLGKYVEALRGLYDVGENQSGEDYERMLQQIQEEVFADAYAGINAFDAGANRFTSAVNEKMEQLGTGRFRSQENGVRETNGPPSTERFSADEAVDNMRSLNISRQFIQYKDTASENRIENEKINSLISRGKVIEINGETLAAINDTDWNDYKGARICIRNILEKFLGLTVHFSHGNQKASAYLTRNGIKHTVAGSNTKEKAKALNEFVKLVRNAEYAYSSVNDTHNDVNGAIEGEKDWDCFISVAKIGKNNVPIIFKIRTIDTDIRSQIYSIATKNETSYSRGGVQQNNLQDAHPNTYGESPVSGNKLSQKDIGVKMESSSDSYMTDEEFRERYGLKLRAVDEVEDVPDSQTFGEAEDQRKPRESFSVDDETDSEEQQVQEPEQKQEKPKRRSIKPMAESKPILAKKDLRSTMMNLFSIPEGSRAELGGMIDAYADRLIKNGALTEADRKAFFDRMYDSGVMTMPAEDYFSEGRNLLKGGRVYVPDSVRKDFGDDWGDIRRRAFGAGIYFTSDRSAGGIDSWNHELAEELPGLFDSEETDLRSILERIVDVAEEGKDEKLSLAEYTARLAEQDYISEREFLDNMERQMDWALRTFAEKARLEIHLRDRTGSRIAKEREEHREMAQRQKDRKELRELQQKTLKTLQWLNKNRNRAPEELKQAFDEVLSDIDIYAVGAANEMRWSDKYNASWKDLAQMFKDASKNDPNFLPSKELERIVARLDGTKISEMDLGALNDLYKAAVGLRTEFYNRNNVISDEMNRLFAEVYTDAKKEIEAAPSGYSGKKMDKFINLDQLTPMNVLQRMGGWDPDGTFYSMAKQLEKGERDMRAYSVKAQKMLQDFLTEHEDWVKKADGQGKDGIWYEIEIPELIALELGKKPQFGATIKVSMTPAQKVHMYLESKNVDNLRHMTGGRTFADKKLYSEGKRQEALAQGKTVRMAPETVKAIVSDLTAEELELARLLEQYYNSFATQEINRVSNILYGYDKAMGKNYAPIYTNRNYTKTEFGVFDQTAEGVGNLKGRQYSVNPSYNISAFDAFERHVDQTARFVGMAIPARNWTNLMNWREQKNSTGDVITHKWGEEGKRYITDLINTLQAGDDVKSDTVSSAVSKLQSTYITAIFGANPSIVLKQLGSIPLASAYLDAKNIPTPQQIKNIDRDLIGKYSQDLTWRTMGYSMPETRQLKENPNWTQTNKFYNFTFGGGAITAMDGWASSVLWPWAENKVRRDFPDLEIGTQEQIEKGESPFYKKVAELFEDALSRSQSTSDEIHQSSLRKSKNPITKAFTMFRSDSAQTYNTLRQKIGEAQYYMRTGAKEQVKVQAKKAVGAAFMALLMNSMWSEAINFLMALWKNKGKNYRDEEDELTFQSVAGEMASGMVGSFGGIVTGGEEVLEIIGNLLTGEKIYDIETPGIEQLNDLVTAVTDAGGTFRDVIAGAADIAIHGGDMGEYFHKNSGEILGSIKELAETAVMYLPGLSVSGLPVSNLEAYLLGAVKWLSPELGAAYDDLFQSVGKNKLSGLEGEVLKSRVGRILDDRDVSQSEETAKALAVLYEAGQRAAVPGDVPSSVTVNGEKRTLRPFEQQSYDTIWKSIVSDALDELVRSDSFVDAGEETQAKMVSKLYDYAAERAKAEMFEEYEMDSAAQNISEIHEAGLEVADCIAWYTETSGMKQAEKFKTLRQWDMPNNAKKDIMGTIMGTDLKTEAGNPTQYAKMLDALKSGISVDQYLDIRMMDADIEDYLEMVENGLNPNDAYELTGNLDDLEPRDGEDKVDNVQRWRECIKFSDNVGIQLAALRGVADDNQFAKIQMAYDFGVNPDSYVSLQEIKSQHDADGNGSFTNAEMKAAVDSLPGLTTEQRAVLWQLGTGNTSAKNNPYSREVGQQIVDARAAAKEGKK